MVKARHVLVTGRNRGKWTRRLKLRRSIWRSLSYKIRSEWIIYVDVSKIGHSSQKEIFRAVWRTRRLTILFHVSNGICAPYRHIHPYISTYLPRTRASFSPSSSPYIHTIAIFSTLAFLQVSTKYHTQPTTFLPPSMPKIPCSPCLSPFTATSIS